MGTEDAEPETAPIDNAAKAFALARLGVKVFPVRIEGRAPAIEGGKGFYDATSDDFELIATWFSVDFVGDKYAVGYWTGGSGLFVADVDRGKSNGKDGFKSIKDRGLDVGKTHAYRTRSGGEHRVFATDRIDLTLSQDYDGIEGLDIRAGGSYAVWWGNEVPESRDAFSTDIPEWMLKTSEKDVFTGEGFSGGVNDWLEAIPDDALPSGRTRDFMSRIPEGEFGHPEMVDLAWSIVRLGSERETGVATALGKLRDAWLRKPYDTPANRRDFDLAVRGAINKAGRVQEDKPVVGAATPAMNRAVRAGVADEIKTLNQRAKEAITESARRELMLPGGGVSETTASKEIELSRIRKEMFRVAAEAGLGAADAFTLVVKSRALEGSIASPESAWFSDGEPFFRNSTPAEEDAAEGAALLDQIEEEWASKSLALMVRDIESFSFLSEAERTVAEAYDWWGRDYLAFFKARLKHFNKPYHVSAMWAALSVIASPWGKVRAQGGKPTDCNLYLAAFGESTSGKSESWGFGVDMIDAYYGLEGGPIIGDIQKLSALALHRALILRDGEASLVYGDEIQSFFQGVANTQWQNGILGDISSHYGGNVSPKLTLNDKEISGKRAKTMFTTYLTGIANQMLEAISIDHWTNGFFYRYLWSFGEPRQPSDFEITFSTSKTDYTDQLKAWANEFKRVKGFTEMVRGGLGREVDWDEDARKRMGEFSKQIDDAVKHSSLYDTVFVPSNVRFLTSIMKCATLVALVTSSESVKLEHVLVALNFAGPWHRSMVLAVAETGKEPFEREVEKALVWIRRNANRGIGKRPWIQRSAVMREFKPSEAGDRLLRQLTEEGWLIRSGDKYELSEG